MMADLYAKNWMIKNVDTVLFDKDGTFIDAHVYWGRIIELRIQAVMNFYQVDDKYFDELCLSLGYDTKNKILIEKGPIALLAREAVVNSLIEKLKELNINAVSSEIADIFKNVHEKFLDEIFDYVKPIKEAEVLFKRLKEKGVKLAVVTSDMKLNTDAILEKTNLAQYFDLVIGKDNCTKAKKTGEPALIALKLLNANANTTISVGDAPMDYEMAKNANLKGSILVSTGQIPETKLKQLTDTTVQNLSEVIVK